MSERIDVPIVVEQEQVEFYVDNGYLAVPNLLDAAELDELKRDIVKVARGGYPNLTIDPVPPELSDEEVLPRFWPSISRTMSVPSWRIIHAIHESAACSARSRAHTWLTGRGT
ncbi:MAG: hypothetical protein OXF54_14975 [Caldilineaceae bacterium]|nr:hypothetical protein [Caldilineaceae bacterium]